MVRAFHLLAALPLARALYIPHGALAPIVEPVPNEITDFAPSQRTRLAVGQNEEESRAHKAYEHTSHRLSTNAQYVGTFADEAGKAPVITPMFTDGENILKDKYIIVFKKGVSPEDISKHFGWVNAMHLQHVSMLDKIQHPFAAESNTGLIKTYSLGDGFRGYAGTFLPVTLEAIRTSPIVDFIEVDSKVHVAKVTTQNGAPWGLARVSHREKLSLGTFNKYIYDDVAGQDVTSYVIDTGIYVEHSDFGGRASWGKTVPPGDVDKDAHGHGSHCAGTIAGAKYGIAKKAKVVAVKVLSSDGSGSMSDVLGGVEFAVEAHKKEKSSNPKHKGSTVNMSLGGGKSPALEVAVNAATEQGLHFAVAAGNENQDACNVSPAGADSPITVGATDLSDARASFSNFGKCVDIFGPGVNILSIGTTDPNASATMSGTSMASPHIAGLLTYFLSLQPSKGSEYERTAQLTPKQLKERFIKLGSTGLITGLDKDSPNILAFNGAGKNLMSLWENNFEVAEEESAEDPFSLTQLSEVLLSEYEDIVGYTSNLFSDLRVALGGRA